MVACHLSLARGIFRNGARHFECVSQMLPRAIRVGPNASWGKITGFLRLWHQLWLWIYGNSKSYQLRDSFRARGGAACVQEYRKNTSSFYMRHLRIPPNTSIHLASICATSEYFYICHPRIYLYAPPPNISIHATSEYIYMRHLRIYLCVQPPNFAICTPPNISICATSEYIYMRHLRLHLYAPPHITSNLSIQWPPNTFGHLRMYVFALAGRGARAQEFGSSGDKVARRRAWWCCTAVAARCHSCRSHLGASTFLCVCVCVCVCVCCVCVCVWGHICIYVCIYIYIHVYIYMSNLGVRREHAQRRSSASSHMYMYICKYIVIYINTYKYIYLYK